MKSGFSIYLVPLSPVFNPEAVSLFGMMDNEHSSILLSTLYLNNVEIIEKINEKHNAVFCINSSDQQNVPQELLSSAVYISIMGPGNPNSSLKYLDERHFSKYSRNLVIFSKTIGLNETDIQKIFELLSVEEDAVVIGKGLNNSISFLGFTKYHQELFSNIEKGYDNYLSVICKHNYFVTVVEKGMYISSWDDFKNLYTELSKKESLAYCSHKMHEQFTHLFIEYKEQIK